jgi:hypothetical protein
MSTSISTFPAWTRASSKSARAARVGLAKDRLHALRVKIVVLPMARKFTPLPDFVVP